jgi:Zn-dependent protease with chaperone function
LGLLVVLSAAPVSAEAAPWPQDRVIVTVALDGRGAMSIDAYGPGSLAPAALAQALAESFRCKPEDFASSQRPTETHVSGRCSRAMSRHGDIFQETWDLLPLRILARERSVLWLDTYLTYPEFEIAEVTPPLPDPHVTLYNWRYAARWEVARGATPIVLGLAYGFKSGVSSGALMALGALLATIMIAVILLAARRARTSGDRASGWWTYRQASACATALAGTIWFTALIVDHGWARLGIALGWAGKWHIFLVAVLIPWPFIIWSLVAPQIATSVWRDQRGWPISRGKLAGNALIVGSLNASAIVMAVLAVEVVSLLGDLSSDQKFYSFSFAWFCWVGLWLWCGILHLALRRNRRLRQRELLAGEFRNSIDTMATAAGVRFRKIFILSGPFTDPYVNAMVQRGLKLVYYASALHQLSRTELDAVTLMEIGRAKLHHASKLVGLTIVTLLTIVAAMVAVPVYFPSAMAALPGFILLSTLASFHVKRRLCLARDRLCATMSRDPATLISALVRIADFNMEPLAHRGWLSWLVSHPSMTVRFRAIADAAHLTQDDVAAAIVTGRAPVEDRYVVNIPEVVAPAAASGAYPSDVAGSGLNS